MESIIYTYPGMTQTQKEKIEKTVLQERKKLFNFIKSKVSQTEDAEDILQDVFYQLIGAYETIREIDKLTTWLYTVARNKITDFYRKKKGNRLHQQEMDSSLVHEMGSLMLVDILPDIAHTPDQQLIKDMLWETIDQAISEMPEEQRQVFVWHEFEEKSFKEMMELTGENQNTLLSRKRYAVLFLRKKLGNIYQEFNAS